MSSEQFLKSFNCFYVSMTKLYGSVWSDGSSLSMQYLARQWLPKLYQSGCSPDRLGTTLATELHDYFKKQPPGIDQVIQLIQGKNVSLTKAVVYKDTFYQSVSDLLIEFRKDSTAGNIRSEWSEAEHKDAVNYWATTLIEFEIKDPSIISRGRSVVRKNLKKYSSFAPNPLEFVVICQSFMEEEGSPETAALIDIFNYFGVCYGGKYISKDEAVRKQYLSAWEKELKNYGMYKVEYINAGLLSLKSNLRLSKRAPTPVEIAAIMVTAVHTEIHDVQTALLIATGSLKVDNPHPLVYHTARMVGHHKLKTVGDSFVTNEFKTAYLENLLKVASGELILKQRITVPVLAEEQDNEKIADRQATASRLKKLFK